MSHNQTIDGVPRELLKRIYRHLFVEPSLNRDDSKKLRALLDAPDQCAHEFESPTLSSMPDYCAKCSIDKPAAKPQGDPVAWQRKSKNEDGRWFALPDSDVEEAIRLGYEVRKLYAEQPAPVAVVPERLVMTDGLHTYEYVTGHNDCIDKMLGIKS